MKVKITLEEKLKRDGYIGNNIIVSSNLVKELEVYGFVNSCKEDDFNYSYFLEELFPGLIDKGANRRIICSGFMYQASICTTIQKPATNVYVIPIYSSLKICKEDLSIPLQELYIPSLLNNDIYIDIKSRKKYKKPINSLTPSKYKLPKNITENNGELFFGIKEGDTIFLDKYNQIKSIGEIIMVLCRYVNPESNNMCYITYEMNEVFVEEENV